MLPDFHRTTFRLLGREPAVSPTAERRLAMLERAIRVELPASLREWYSMEGAAELLDLEDELLHFAPYTIEMNAKTLARSEEERRPLWWGIGDYSSGVWFAAELAAGPDPVVHCLETDGSIVDATDGFCERPFSAFVFTCCWYKAQEGAANAGVVAPAFGPAHLRLLADRFDAGPHVRRGDYPAEKPNAFTGRGRLPVSRFRYFFFGPQALVQVVARDDPAVASTRAVLELTSPDEDGLRALSTDLRENGILP